jgi:pentatricopeptide repeat protein
MDLLKFLRVPFQATSLMMVAIFAVLLALFDSGGLYGIILQLFLQIWVLKYCYVVLEHIADGAAEPPVMSTDMLSPFEVRPWIQLGIVVGFTAMCMAIPAAPLRIGVSLLLIALLPATIAVLGVGEPFYQAINPLLLWRLIRGLGPYYLVIVASQLVYGGLIVLMARLDVWGVVGHAVMLICEMSFFTLIGGCIFLRRRQIGIEPSRTPERAAAREEAERVKLRARMLDDVFQQVRIGKHVEATRPLAQWMSSLDGATAAKDAQYVVSQALGWDSVSGLNTLGSTLIRHLLRAGRPDTALLIFEKLRQRSPALTLDSPDDLRSLADYAQSAGRAELATSMRLETPIFRP